ncbi:MULTISPECIES: hypothetical protein [Cyanobium]|uniref:DUF218 domain-containing protein n=1 Tax=Cyanobium usitatum str. Tous TaxID=2116684 RepID=A0A2P7MQX8_9CYAN|nr:MULTISPECIES: hypothetical protein [Cyanobium]MCP9781585.1 hypothetical protein [Cyanobium sp. To12R1]PSJ03640.1 hypothetical protein C7K55_12515 [Cyanobium usitatum str. Tous]
MLLPIPFILAAGLWVSWPWIAPQLRSTTSAKGAADLVVVLDGIPSRLAAAERIVAALPAAPQHLLIRCPGLPLPPQAMSELLQGFDTATQITALAQWFAQQQSPRPLRVWIATDPDHTARAVLNAQIALGPLGIQVGPTPPPQPSHGERHKIMRDALRLQLWRATGSTGAWLAPEVAARKHQACGL